MQEMYKNNQEATEQITQQHMGNMVKIYASNASNIMGTVSSVFSDTIGKFNQLVQQQAANQVTILNNAQAKQLSQIDEVTNKKLSDMGLLKKHNKKKIIQKLNL